MSEEKGREREIEVVAEGQIKKKGLVSKFLDIFIEEDLNVVVGNVVQEVVIPGAKEVIGNAAKDTIDMMLHGSTDVARSSRSGGKRYEDIFASRTRRASDGNVINKKKQRYSFDDVILTRKQAKDVLKEIKEDAETYSVISVADLYEAEGVGEESVHTDENWGWDEDLVDQFYPKRIGYDRYIIKTPKPINIKNM